MSHGSLDDCATLTVSDTPRLRYELCVTCLEYRNPVANLFDDDDLRRFSRSLFGQDNRLAVMLIIARTKDPFTLTDLADGIGAKHTSSVQGPVKVLHGAGLIYDITSPAKERLYSRSDSTAWAFAEELYRRFNGQEALFT